MEKRNIICVLGTVVLLAALAGCAGMRGPAAEQVVMDQAKAFAADLTAGNADKLLGYVSDSFTNDRVADKATLAKYLQEAKDKGQVEKFKGLVKDHHGEIDFAQAKAKVEKGVATVYPIVASADEGSVTVELTYKRDPDKVWRISGINIEGI